MLDFDIFLVNGYFRGQFITEKNMGSLKEILRFLTFLTPTIQPFRSHIRVALLLRLYPLSPLLSPFSSSLKDQLKCLPFQEIFLSLPPHSIRCIHLLSSYFSLLYIMIIVYMA